jgi:hypothetical protein
VCFCLGKQAGSWLITWAWVRGFVSVCACVMRTQTGGWLVKDGVAVDKPGGNVFVCEDPAGAR